MTRQGRIVNGSSTAPLHASPTSLSPQQQQQSSQHCCSIPVLKLGLAVYNILLLGCGGCLVGASVWSLVSKQDHVAVLSSLAYQSVSWTLLLAGVLSLFAAVLGCVALAREDRCSLVTYIFLVVLVLVLEGVAGVLAYVYEEQLLHILTRGLQDVISNSYYVDDDVTHAVDAMQQEFYCCAGVTFTEWKTSQWYKLTGGATVVPDTCCKTITPGCGARDHPSNIWYSGCIHGLSASLAEHLLLLGGLGCGLSLLQVLGVTIACCLYVILAKTP
uniref:Tetraspanin n=1 Tax=Hirondellea gigas TaxID=1518452 RepID=A0A2P2IBX6_9CRUS